MNVTSAADPLASLRTENRQTNDNRSELGQEEYLELMITQFQNQDPFKPMENGDFIAQLAQFGTVSGIAELQESFSAVAASISSDQTLQASGLIGRTVLAEVDTGPLTEGGELMAAVDLPEAAGAVTVEVRDSAGALVRTLELGAQPAGLARFTWDGVTAQGEQAASGLYTFSARVETPSGPQAVNTLVAAQVESISLAPDTGALALNFRDMAPLSLRQVRQIM